MSFESQPATRAGGPRPDAADDAGDPPGDLYQPSHFQGADTGAQDLAQPSHFGNTQDLAQPSHFGTGESLTQLTARMSVLESVSRRATRSSLDNVASMRAGPGATPSTATSMRAAAMRAKALEEAAAEEAQAEAEEAQEEAEEAQLEAEEAEAVATFERCLVPCCREAQVRLRYAS